MQLKSKVCWWLAGIFLLSACTNSSVPPISIAALKCEYKVNPQGIDVMPRLSWEVQSKEPGIAQTAYEILVASNQDLLDRDSGDLWSTGKVLSDETIQILFGGSPLKSHAQYHWKVRFWDNKSRISAWSEAGHWSAGLLDSLEWQAQWIGYDAALDDTTYGIVPWANNMTLSKPYRPLPCSYLRKEFTPSKPLKRAVIYTATLGLSELHLNGERIDPGYLNAGWTEYKKRVYYRTYDVTKQVQSGTNTLGYVLADGWFTGTVANRAQQFYGKSPRTKSQLHLFYEDGSTEIVSTDSTWKASFGPLVASDMQAGETYNAQLEMPGWATPQFTASEWSKVDVGTNVQPLLQAHPGLPVQIVKELGPYSIQPFGKGTYLVDMGQNFAGWIELKVQGQQGDTVTMKFAEILNPDASLHTRNLRSARATDTYVLKGDQEERWQPQFTYHGFRYVLIEGYPGKLTKKDLVGKVAHTEMARTGFFQCSDSTINRFYENALWSQRSNFWEVPTDCPQRDERMGWSGDAQLFAPMASYNMDVAGFYSKWMQDMADGQLENGQFPSTAPLVYSRIAMGWADAGIIIPWEMYRKYHDKRILEAHYPAMQKWVHYLDTTSSDFISNEGSFGDWQNLRKVKVDQQLFATAYWAQSTHLLANIAAILNKTEAAQKYQQLASNVRAAFTDKFVELNGHMTDSSQTAYLLALEFDLVPDSMRALVFEQLLLQMERDSRLTTGIHGTAYLLKTLANNGRPDKAMQLLTNRQYPSWGYQIELGATTIWERWNSVRQKNIHKDSTNSLNHFAFGAPAQWLYSGIGGINSDSAAFKRIRIQPTPADSLTFANTTYRSIRGTIASFWKIEDGFFFLTVEIPANTEATVVLPPQAAGDIRINGYKMARVSESEHSIPLVSGRYMVQTEWAEE